MEGGGRRGDGEECVDKRGLEEDGNEENDVRKKEYHKQTQFVQHV